MRDGDTSGESLWFKISARARQLADFDLNGTPDPVRMLYESVHNSLRLQSCECRGRDLVHETPVRSVSQTLRLL